MYDCVIGTAQLSYKDSPGILVLFHSAALTTNSILFIKFSYELEDEAHKFNMDYWGSSITDSWRIYQFLASHSC